MWLAFRHSLANKHGNAAQRRGVTAYLERGQSTAMVGDPSAERADKPYVRAIRPHVADNAAKTNMPTAKGLTVPS